MSNLQTGNLTEADDQQVNSACKSDRNADESCAINDDVGSAAASSPSATTTTTTAAAAATSRQTSAANWQYASRRLAARVASLETCQTAMENLQALLSAKSAELIECAARLRASDAARLAAERKWETFLHRQIVSRLNSTRSGVANATKEDTVSGSDERVPKAGTSNSDGSEVDRRPYPASECRKTVFDMSLYMLPHVGSGGVDVTATTCPSVRFRTPQHEPGGIGDRDRTSNDLVEKLIRQNARLKQALKQMIEIRHRMTVSEYLVCIHACARANAHTCRIPLMSVSARRPIHNCFRH